MLDYIKKKLLVLYPLTVIMVLALSTSSVSKNSTLFHNQMITDYDTLDKRPVKVIKIFMVHSYNPDHICTAPQREGFVNKLHDLEVESRENKSMKYIYRFNIRSFYMWTKLEYTSIPQIKERAKIAIQKIRHTIYYAITDFLNSRDFTRFDTPIFTPTIAEDSTALYSVEHPSGETMYLNQSWQLYLEAAIHWHRYVYDFGPVFRAERSKTRRHLNELWMMDAEMAFMDFRQSMELQEQLIYHIIQEVLTKHRQDLELLGRDISKLENIKLPFIRKTYKEVIEELQKMWVDIKYWEDLGADEERILMEKYDQPVFVTNYPLEVKAFYMPEDPENPWTAKNSDLLAPEGYGEIIWWSERIWNYETLKQRIIQRGYNLDDYKWYLDLRKYWGVTTSGFGVGLERTLAWITGIPHIREAIPFPRYYNRIRP